MIKDSGGIVVTLNFLFQKIHDLHLGHILEGVFLFAPFALFGHPFVGWCAVSFYFLGRERRDQEMHLTHYPDVMPFNPVTDWWRYWSIWKWTKDGQLDLFLPVIFWGVVAWILN